MQKNTKYKIIVGLLATAPLFRTAEFDIMFDHGISREGDMLDLGVTLGLIKKSGAFFSWGDVRLGQGRENAKTFLFQNGEIAKEIEQQVRASALPGTIVAPPKDQ